MENVPLKHLADVLGVSKSVASRLRSGEYQKNPDLTRRYAALCALLTQSFGSNHVLNPAEICNACPRESCAGCRIAEI